MKSSTKKPWGAIAIFIGPIMIYYLIFTIYPLLATLWYSVHNITPKMGEIITTFVGLQNFIDLFSDDIFITAVKNTSIWAILGPAIEMFVSLALALVVYFGTPLKRFDNAWRKCCSLAGITDFHFHDLRHTYCSNLLLSGANIKDVKEMIGHSDIAMTDRYSHLTLAHHRDRQKALSDHYLQVSG